MMKYIDRKHEMISIILSVYFFSIEARESTSRYILPRLLQQWFGNVKSGYLRVGYAQILLHQSSSTSDVEHSNDGIGMESECQGFDFLSLGADEKGMLTG